MNGDAAFLRIYLRLITAGVPKRAAWELASKMEPAVDPLAKTLVANQTKGTHMGNYIKRQTSFEGEYVPAARLRRVEEENARLRAAIRELQDSAENNEDVEFSDRMNGFLGD